MASELPTHVYSVLINLQDDHMLVPNAAVADVAGQEAFQHRSGTPDWWLGAMRWQSRDLPVVSIEGMLGRPVPPMERKCRLVALNTPSEAGAFAIVGRSYPMIITLNEAAITAETEADEEPDKLIYSRVQVANRHGLIPDLDALASMVRQACG